MQSVPGGHGALHLGLESPEAVPALRPGGVHGNVRLTQQGVRLQGAPVGDGDADRGPDVDLPPIDVERLSQGLEDPVGGINRFNVRRAVEEDGELMPAQPGAGVVLTQAAVDALADLHQNEVTDVMAERVVDDLEAV